MSYIRSTLTAALACIAALGIAAITTPAAAQAKFPSKPVIMQVPFSPGGGADRTFRLFAPYLSKELGVPVKVTLDEAGFEKLVEGLKGLTYHEAERALCGAVADDLALTESDLDDVLEQKRRMLREGGVLEYVPVETTLAEVGGLGNLKRWLAKRGIAPRWRSRRSTPRWTRSARASACGGAAFATSWMSWVAKRSILFAGMNLLKS